MTVPGPWCLLWLIRLFEQVPRTLYTDRSSTHLLVTALPGGGKCLFPGPVPTDQRKERRGKALGSRGWPHDPWRVTSSLSDDISLPAGLDTPHLPRVCIHSRAKNGQSHSSNPPPGLRPAETVQGAHATPLVSPLGTSSFSRRNRQLLPFPTACSGLFLFPAHLHPLRFAFQSPRGGS